MTNLTPEQIRDGVELADGWSAVEDRIGGSLNQTAHFVRPPFHVGKVLPQCNDCDEYILAALASQLISQVDAMDGVTFTSYENCAVVLDEGVWKQYDGPNREDNNILACTEFLRGRE